MPDSSDLASMLAVLPPGTISPEDYAQLLRNMQLAPAAVGMALTPPQVQQPQGSNRGFYQAARVSPLSGLSKLAEAYMGRQATDKANVGMANMYSQMMQAMPSSYPGMAGYGQPQGQPQGSAQPQQPPGQSNLLNPGVGAAGGDPQQTMLLKRAGFNLLQKDPGTFVKLNQGTPEYQNAMQRANNDPDLANLYMRIDALPPEAKMAVLAYDGNPAAMKAQLQAVMEKARSESLRSGSSLVDLASHTGMTAPDVQAGLQFTGNPVGPGGISAQPIPGEAALTGARQGYIAGNVAANQPQQVPGATGPTFVKPGAPGLPPGLPAPQTPRMGSLGQGAPAAAPRPPPSPPGAPGAAPGASAFPTVRPPPGGYLGNAPTAAPANAPLSTAGIASQQQGGKQGQEYANSLAMDSNNALDVRRSLAELKNLAKTAPPAAANNLKLQAGTMMMAAGADPASVSQFLGIDIGSLQAAQKQTAGLAVASIHQMTSRGTNFDLDTFMKNNPNFMQTGTGFGRVIDYMDAKAKDAIARQRDFQDWTKTGDSGQPVPPEQWMAGHTAHWNAQVEKQIEAGKTNSRPPIESFNR